MSGDQLVENNLANTALIDASLSRNLNFTKDGVEYSGGPQVPNPWMTPTLFCHEAQENP